MAAVLCSACGDIGSSLCSICGKACQVPFQACNVLCDGCGHACEQTCTALGNLTCFASPFAVFVVVATIFNIPSIWMGLTGWADEGMSCKGVQWLAVQALFCLANIVAAVYMGITVAKEVTPDQYTQQQQQQQPIPASAFARAGHLMCYDPWIAIYILVVCGFFVWQWTGAAWTISGHAQEGCNANGDDDGVAGRVALALGFGWAFLFFGVASLCLGVCCAYCWDKDNNNNEHHQDTEANATLNTKPPAPTYGGTASKQSSVPVVSAEPAPLASTKDTTPTAQAVLF